MTNDEKKSLAEELLQRQKHKELGRLPRKNDFDEPTRSRIKAFLVKKSTSKYGKYGGEVEN